MTDELIGYDAVGLSEQLKRGEISLGNLLEIVTQRIEKINPLINADIHKMYDQTRKTAVVWSSEIIAEQWHENAKLTGRMKNAYGNRSQKK